MTEKFTLAQLFYMKSKNFQIFGGRNFEQSSAKIFLETFLAFQANLFSDESLTCKDQVFDLLKLSTFDKVWNDSYYVPKSLPKIPIMSQSPLPHQTFQNSAAKLNNFLASVFEFLRPFGYTDLSNEVLV